MTRSGWRPGTAARTWTGPRSSWTPRHDEDARAGGAPGARGGNGDRPAVERDAAADADCPKIPPMNPPILPRASGSLIFPNHSMTFFTAFTTALNAVVIASIGPW